MIEKLSISLSKAVAKQIPMDNAEHEVMEYGIYMALSEFTKLSVILSASFILGFLKYTIYIIVIFGILRNFLGGFHAKTNIGCFISYLSTIALIAIIGLTIKNTFIITISGISLYPLVLLAIYRYAPADVENKPITSSAQRKFLRRGSVLVVTLLYVAFMIIPYPYRNFTLLTILAETCTMLPLTYKLTKNNYGVERSCSL